VVAAIVTAVIPGTTKLEVICVKCGRAMPYVAELDGKEFFCLGCGSSVLMRKREQEARQSEDSELTKRTLLKVRISEPQG
jgi:DNA-directed RNA polymerase subunit RPC12/RpoP